MVLKKTELKNVSTDLLHISPKNPRINDGAVPKVARSLIKFGYIKVSIGVDEDMVLLYGHTTLAAFNWIAELPPDQWGEIKNPCIVPEVTQIKGLSEDQKTAYRIVDNRAAEFSSWDSPALLEQLQQLEANDFDLEAIGFDEDDIQQMLDDLQVPAPNFTSDEPSISNDESDYVPTGFSGTRQYANHCPRCGFDWDTTVKSEPIKSLKERMHDGDEK